MNTLKNNKVSIVTVLTPIATAFAAVLSGWVAKHAPGVNVPTGDLVPIMVLGGTSAAGAALHWLHKQTKVVQLETAVDQVAQKVVDKVQADPTASAASQDLLAKLESQKSEILSAIASAVHLPPSAEEVAQEILDQAAAKRVEPASNVVPLPTAASPAPQPPVTA